MNTCANIKFTVLVEIKKPNTPIFDFDKSGKPKRHRNGASLLNDELTGGVSQLQANCYRWDTEGAEQRENVEELLSKNVFTYQPKGILVIGHTNQLNDPHSRSTFELFRRNTDNPEIITFDELYERAKFIVNQNEEQKVNESIDSSNILDEELESFDEIDDDLPF